MYLEKCLNVIATLDDFTISHIPREGNIRANDLTQQASGYQVRRGKLFMIEKPLLEGATIYMAEQHDNSSNALKKSSVAEPNNWRKSLIGYLENLSQSVDRKLRRQALKYTLFDGELYRQTIDGLLLKCLGFDQFKVVMGEVHEGICGTHQSVHKMKWLLKRAGFY